MEQTPRDIQFKGFAKLVVDELMESNALGFMGTEGVFDAEDLDELSTIIAHRAYDLLVHAVYRTSFLACWQECTERIRPVPDMTTWDEQIRGTKE